MFDSTTNDELLTTAEAAKALGISRSWLETGRAPGARKRYGPAFVRVGGRVLYRRSVLNDYLAARVEDPSEK